MLADLETSFQKLEQTVVQFPPQEFNKQPSDTSWSAAQIVEHLLILEKLAIQAIRGETIPSTRAADSKTSIIKWAMEDETKRVAPQIVMPSGNMKDKQELLQALKEAREKLKTAINDVDITEACKAFKHPALGTLTRLEWIFFTIVHTDRHRRQIDELKKSTVASV